jgi:hypothetical protein
MTRIATINIAAKVALIALLLHAAAFPDLPQYRGKAIGFRLALYPVSALLVPAIRWAWRKRTTSPYPHLIDLCVCLPFLTDTAGNAANLFDTLTWFDDFLHVFNWIIWVSAFGLTLRYLRLGRLNVAALTVGFGAVTHILWEIGEYLTFISNNPNELATAYTDTIGDLAGSLTGSFVGGLLVATALWNVGRPPGGPSGETAGTVPASPGPDVGVLR